MNIDLSIEEVRHPLPNFTHKQAIEKVRKAENAWNAQQPELVATAYSLNSQWRNRDSFISGRTEIVAFLTAKWQREKHYKLVKELWSVTGNRIAVRFAYEWQNDKGQWFRSHGNENWQFNEKGLMEQRYASINDVKIEEGNRKFLWRGLQRPDDFPELSELGL
ncbi:nuclear transport factor 2 family protein [Thalassotalea sp. PLHSN55]|uniref:nuclear transport factor 2 family protein n=1 Tax=Thalassotalea sp. PLHSN55 TaxID=3435888 RepID=UPI003F827A1C